MTENTEAAMKRNWSTATYIWQAFTEERIDQYLSPAVANLPTRTLCKGLAISLAGRMTEQWKQALNEGRPSTVELFVPAGGAQNIVYDVGEFSINKMAFLLSRFYLNPFYNNGAVADIMFQRLFRWAKEHGPSPKRNHWRFVRTSWRKWLADQIDWEVIARKLKREHALCRRGAEGRLQELLTGTQSRQVAV